MKKKYYFLSILISFLFNIFNVNALEVDFKTLEVMGYNNNGTSLTTGEQFYCDSSNGNCSMYLTTLANSYGGAWGIQSPISIIENHTYSISLEMRSPNSGLTLSSKSNISIGTTLDNAVNNYINSSYNTNIIVSSVKNNIIQYGFKANSNAYYLIIPFTTFSDTYSVFYIDKLIIEDLGEGSVSQSEINNIMSNQTSIIQNDINNLEESINNNIKDTFEDCTTGKNLWTYPNKSFNILGLDVSVNNNNININGTTNWSGWMFRDSGRPTFYLDSGTYTFSVHNYRGNFSNSFGFVFHITSNGETILDRSVNNSTINNYSVTFNVPTSGNVSFDIYLHSANALFNNVSFNVQLESGDQVTSFEPFCKNRLDVLNDTQKETNNKLDDLNNNITNSDSSGASSEAGDFFSNFNTDTFGLTSVITAPLELIKSVTSKSCTPLQLTLPFVNEDLNLPCLSTIYENYFGSFLTIYRTITFGFVSYWVCIKIFNLVKDFKNPEHDEIEVLDL